MIDLIKEKLPVSISLGLWMTIISYAISIPLGVKKAVRDGTPFDWWTSAVVIVGYAIPGFLFAILLIVLFAGGSFWQVFPLRGLWSEQYADMSFWAWVTTPAAILDYFWHLALPITAMAIGALRHDDASDEEFLRLSRSGRVQYVDNRTHEGALGAAGALRACFPQRHADRGGRFSRRPFISAFFTGALTDRDDLLSRRARLALLRIHRQPGLPGRLRHPLSSSRCLDLW